MPGEISRSNPGGDGSIPWHALSPEDQAASGKSAYFLLHEWRFARRYVKTTLAEERWLAEFTEKVDRLLGLA